MKKIESKLEIRNQWLAGWNYGWLGKKEQSDQVEDWYRGYQVGTAERQKTSSKSQREKKFLESL